MRSGERRTRREQLYDMFMRFMEDTIEVDTHWDRLHIHTCVPRKEINSIQDLVDAIDFIKDAHNELVGVLKQKDMDILESQGDNKRKEQPNLEGNAYITKCNNLLNEIEKNTKMLYSFYLECVLSCPLPLEAFKKPIDSLRDLLKKKD